MSRLACTQFWKNSTVVKRGLHLAGLTVGLVLFFYQAYLGLAAMAEQRLKISLEYLLLPAGINVCSYLVQMLSWTLVMECMEVPVGIYRTIRGYTLSFLPRYIPGSVWGYWSRGEWLRHALGVGYPVSFLGSIIEAVAFVITAIGVGFCMLGMELDRVILAAILAALILGWLSLGIITRMILYNRGVIGTLTQKPTRISQLQFLLKWTALLAPYVVFWMLYGTAFALLARTTSSFLELQVTIACTALAWVVGFVTIIIPGGLGIREVTLASLLRLTLGLPLLEGRLAVIAFRATNMFAEIFWLLIGLLLRSSSGPKE